MTNPAAEVSALEWSVIAMRDVTARLPSCRAWDRPRAFAVISEVVWWVTIVDATLVRHHQDVYDSVMAGQIPAERGLIEGTMAGLRFVRNQAGHDVDHVDFIQPEPSGAGLGDSRITAWTWRSVPEPALASLPPRGQAWEKTRYRAYEAHLTARTVGEVFGRAEAFLNQAAGLAASATDVGMPTAR
jgi:hypothetical protein